MLRTRATERSALARGAPGKDAREGAGVGSSPTTTLIPLQQAALTIVTVGLFAFFSLLAPNFFMLANVYDMARVSTFLLIVGVTLTMLLISGEIDLSIGSLFGFSAVVMGLVVVNLGLDPWIGALVAVGTGTLVGALNGVISTIVGVPSFITTIGMLSLLKGASLIITGNVPLFFPSELQSSFFFAANGTIGRLPVQILWGVGVLLLGGFVLRFTPFGAHLYATGGNPRAAKAAGINTTRVKLIAFMAVGASAGLVGALQSGWLREANATTGSGFELQVIAAIIIGGVALTGGAGSVYGTFLGVAIVGMLGNGLVLLGAQGNWNQFFIGVIIVGVATLEVLLKRDRQRVRLSTK